jgi:predicted phage terminase large subunit-like protein
LLETLRHSNNPKFNATIFRRNNTQIFTNGGLWDSAMSLLPMAGAYPKKTPKPQFIFPSGAKVMFDHLERYTDCLSYQGSQIPLIIFDELTHFDEEVFWYMLSRNRSDSGVSGYIRASTNPDPDSWVCSFISWWIGDDGYAIPERSGVIRWFIRINGEVIWGDSKMEMLQYQMEHPITAKKKFDSMSQFPLHGEEGILYYDRETRVYKEWKNGEYKDLLAPKSVTFIASMLSDNAILMRSDPSYLANLQSLPLVEQERLLGGNWKIRPAAGLYFPRSALASLLEDVPNDVVRWVRAWDLAATDTEEGGDPAYTASVLIGKRRNGRYVIADATNHRYKAEKVRELVKQCAVSDKAKYKRVKIRMSVDPGQAGKEQSQSYIKMLAGFSISAVRESGSKESRAEPFAAQWQAGNVDIVAGPWTESLIAQYEAFPEGKFKDMVDAGSNAFNELELANTSSAPPADNGQSATMKSSYWFNR